MRPFWKTVVVVSFIVAGLSFSGCAAPAKAPLGPGYSVESVRSSGYDGTLDRVLLVVGGEASAQIEGVAQTVADEINARGAVASVYHRTEAGPAAEGSYESAVERANPDGVLAIRFVDSGDGESMIEADVAVEGQREPVWYFVLRSADAGAVDAAEVADMLLLHLAGDGFIPEG